LKYSVAAGEIDRKPDLVSEEALKNGTSAGKPFPPPTQQEIADYSSDEDLIFGQRKYKAKTFGFAGPPLTLRQATEFYRERAGGLGRFEDHTVEDILRLRRLQSKSTATYGKMPRHHTRRAG
jgi:hypothetical protein